MKSYKTKQNEVINLLENSDIEYGSNSNGYYIKMSNSFLVCFNKIDLEANQEYATWTFPHPFLDDTYLIIGGHRWLSETYGNVSFGSGNKNSATVYVEDKTHGENLQRGASVIAIGKWK